MTGPAAHSRSLIGFVARRLAGTTVLVAVLSALVFGLLYLAPGDIARNLLGTRPVTPEALAAIRAQYHLGESFPQQYGHWLAAALTGDLGTSIRTGAPVATALAEHAGITVQLAALSFALAVLTSVPLGVVAALRRGGAVDRGTVALAVVGVSAPAFAVGLVLLYVFAVRLSWFPGYGTGDGGADRLRHLVLPAVALAVALGAFVVKLTRTAVLEQLDQDYVGFARSRGLSRGQVLALVLRNAAIPVVTSLGLLVAYLIGGTVLVEVTFALPGLGSLLAESVTFKDLPVVQAVTLLVALTIALTALLVDLTHLAIDPRVRARAIPQ